jgi:hypothetical protein
MKISKRGNTLYPEKFTLFINDKGEWIVALVLSGKLMHLQVLDKYDIKKLNRAHEAEMEQATTPTT